MRPVILAAMCLFFSACRNEMYDQPRSKTFSASNFFADGASARRPVKGTVARGDAGSWDPATRVFPKPVTAAMIKRGQERFDIYCAVCHGATGYGDGMIVERGFPAPPSFHDARLRDAPVGHFYDVITNGYGAMYSYAARVSPEDRWTIIAYIRALQRSQNARLADVPPEKRQELEASQ